MTEVFPDVLRSIVTNIMLILLLTSLAQPKYKSGVIYMALILIMLISAAENFYFYLQSDYTNLAKYDILTVVAGCLIIKPLFKETILQWLFNFVTVMNMYAVIAFSSFYLSRGLTSYMYANTFFRFLLFAAIIFVFRRYMRPVYRQVVKYWNVFFLLVLGVAANFGYYVFSSLDLIKTITENEIELGLLVLLTVVVYITIFYSLKTISEEYILKEENRKIEAQQEVMRAELSAYNDYISIAKQARHDLRHHNAVIREYLASGDIEEAFDYLKQYDDSIVSVSINKYCESHAANAVFRLYEKRTSERNISYAISAQIPEDIPLSSTELGVLLSNILENAYESCVKCKDIGIIDVFVSLNAELSDNILKIDLLNSVCGEVHFDGDIPSSEKQEGGIGMKSVQMVVNKHGGMFRLSQTGDRFSTQIVLPLKYSGLS